MGGDQCPTLRQRKIKLADQFNDLIDRLLVADVDEHPVAVVENEIDTAADPIAGLVVDLDDTGKERTTFKHRKAVISGTICGGVPGRTH